MSKYIYVIKRYQNYQRNLKDRPPNSLQRNHQIIVILLHHSKGTINHHWLKVIFPLISSLSC